MCASGTVGGLLGVACVRLAEKPWSTGTHYILDVEKAKQCKLDHIRH